MSPGNPDGLTAAGQGLPQVMLKSQTVTAQMTQVICVQACESSPELVCEYQKCLFLRLSPKQTAPLD